MNAGEVWCVSRQQNPQSVEEEDYGLKDKKNDIEKEKHIHNDRPIYNM